MAAGHGGARPGSGPKPKSSKGKAPPTDAASHYADPLAYLVAVATGEVPGDGLRVAAAKACLAYTTPKARAPEPARRRKRSEPRLSARLPSMQPMLRKPAPPRSGDGCAAKGAPHERRCQTVGTLDARDEVPAVCRRQSFPIGHPRATK